MAPFPQHEKYSSHFLFFAIAYLTVFAPPAIAEDSKLGISKTQPPKGRFVETEQGFMVPYKVTLPDGKTSFWMEPIPGGKFKLGSPTDEAGRKQDEGPQVTLALEPFWIGRCEVTWAEYQHYYDLRLAFRAFDELEIRQVKPDNLADAVTAPTAIYFEPGRFPPRSEKQHWPTHPAVSMSQFAARQYTKWLSKIHGQFYRLPSEAEWEYACRAGSSTRFHFGDQDRQLSQYAWHLVNAGERTHRVGRLKPNAWGLFDMHGNAAEWVLDAYDPGYGRLRKQAANGGFAVAWPQSQYPRVVRGGSWDDEPRDCRTAARRGSNESWQDEEANIPQSPWWLASSRLHQQIGFRIARPFRVPDKSVQGKCWDADVAKIRYDIEDRLGEGRGFIGIADPDLPKAIRQHGGKQRKR